MTTTSNIETEYLELNRKNGGWPALYQKIRAETASNGNTCSEALKPQNKILNRYRDVSPYDQSRIVLKRGTTDYINANLIKVEKANRQYILTQGPLANTVSHFWLMVWEQGTKAVLMLNKLMEKKQEKCYQYWPAEIGNVMKMEDVGLTLEYLEHKDQSYYLTRILKLTDTESNTSREILQFHYTTWPDFGVPSSPKAFLDFLKNVRASGVLGPEYGPAVIHCSAGIGRSGTFCLVDSCLVLIEKYGVNSVDVKEILREMRKFRMGLIQTPEQLKFSYEAIIAGAKQLQNPSLSPDEEIQENIKNGDENNVSSSEDEEDDDEPPPPPPPRIGSLKRSCDSPVDRPLPMIPNSVSLNDLSYEDNNEKINSDTFVPNYPLPVVPADEESSEDELVEEEEDEENDEIRSESPDSHKDGSKDSTNEELSPSELRHRKRKEKREQIEAKVRDMKRRQQMNEQWTQLKRSLYKPLIIAGTIVIGGGIMAYFYFKH